jgi:hypothetical protein
MIYEWPDKIFIGICDEEKAVSKLIVYCLITSKFKNAFPLEPQNTNEHGEIEFIKEQLLNAIKSSKEEYPMDYHGELSDCDGLKIIIEDQNGIEERLERLKEFYPKEAEKLGNISKNCSNRSYRKFEKKFNIPFPEKIFIKLKRV